MSEGRRADDGSGSDELACGLAPSAGWGARAPMKSPDGAHRRLVASFALSTVGAVLLPLWLAFTLSVALFVPALALVFRLATRAPPHRIRTMARLALAAGLVGLVCYVAKLGLYFSYSMETGLDALLASGGFLLGVGALWAIASKLRSRSSG
jgi:hypothetical protein